MDTWHGAAEYDARSRAAVIGILQVSRVSRKRSGMSVPLEAAEHAGLTFTSLLRGEAGAEEDALRMDRHAPRLCGMACEEK